MASATLSEVLASLIEKTASLGKKIQELESRNAGLQSKIEELEGRLSESEAALERARLDADYLTVSHRLADSPDTLIATRRRISALIRTIDRCISMLKDDPEI